MKPFDLEVWFGERVAVLGSNGSGKSHFLRLLAAGGSDPDVEHRPVGDTAGRAGRAHRPGPARRPGAAGLVRADPHPPGAGRPHPAGDPAPRRRRTAAGHAARAGRPGARPLRAGLRRRAAVRVAVRRPAGPAADPAAGAVRGDPAAARRADRQPRPAVGRGAGGRAGAVRGHGARASPTTAGSRAASTGSWCSAPTGRCTSPTSRSGTRAGWRAPADRRGADVRPGARGRAGRRAGGRCR